MNVWRKGREFLSLIEHKQQLLKIEISQVQGLIKKIDERTAALMDVYVSNAQHIRELSPVGLVSRSEIYQGIHQQGIILSQQQLLLHKLNELKNQRLNQEEILREYYLTIAMLNKKHYKIDHSIKENRRAFLLSKEKRTETDIQEVVYYASKNH